MEDVLKLYEKPLLEKEPVVCMDEKAVVLHAEVRPPRPMQPGQVLRRDCEYVRRGTANAFCGVEPKAGRHFTKVTSNRICTLGLAIRSICSSLPWANWRTRSGRSHEPPSFTTSPAAESAISSRLRSLLMILPQHSRHCETFRSILIAYFCM
jgi:hypothetical protein